MTGQQIITNALTALGLNQMGGTPSTSDSNTSLNELNDLWQAWGIDEGLIYAVIAERFPLASGKAYYTMGPGPNADFPQAEYPARIYGAHFVIALAGGIATTSLDNGGTGYADGDTGVIIGGQGAQATYTVGAATAGVGTVTAFGIISPGSGYLPGNSHYTQTGGSQPGSGTGLAINITSVVGTAGGVGQIRVPLRIENADGYYAHRDLNASSLTPDALYPDFNQDVDGYIRLYLWPIVTAEPSVLELNMGVNFTAWSLTRSYSLPAAYADAIKWALAYRLLPYFGEAVVPSVAQAVTANAEKAELRIREMNKRNRQMPDGSEMLAPPPAQPDKAA